MFWISYEFMASEQHSDILYFQTLTRTKSSPYARTCTIICHGIGQAYLYIRHTLMRISYVTYDMIFEISHLQPNNHFLLVFNTSYCCYLFGTWRFSTRISSISISLDWFSRTFECDESIPAELCTFFNFNYLLMRFLLYILRLN